MKTTLALSQKANTAEPLSGIEKARAMLLVSMTNKTIG